MRRESAATITLESSCMVATSRSAKACGALEKTSKTPRVLPEMAQRGSQNRAGLRDVGKPPSIYMGIILRVVAEHNLAITYAVAEIAELD